MRNSIDAAQFKEMLLCADAALNANVAKINELNVFPVPDGDTGTNMSLTFHAAAAELRKRNFDEVGKLIDCAASALLRGARGNSGVILSLLFRGMSKRLKGAQEADSLLLAAALSDGVDAAYKAVMKPAEGTILTVSRLAARAAVEAANAGATVEAVLKCAVEEGKAALEDTQNQNPVLKKAGVVDAGGMGYIVFLEAMFSALRGEIHAPAEEPSAGADSSAFGVFNTEDINYAFDTVYILRKNLPDMDLLPLRTYLDSIGDSLVIGEDDECCKIHVHTNIPWDALAESRKYGTLELAKIENMRMQHEDILAGRKARSTDDLEETESEPGETALSVPEKRYGVVTVCAGEGMEQLFRELGADGIITGGQTMNPSTDDILHEIERTSAETVFVLPNNKNIIMAAQQCVPLSNKNVVVLPTKTVPQGIAAMIGFDAEETGGEQKIAETMLEAASAVHTAMVTYAARDSDFDGHSIHRGEYLALLDGALIGSYTNIKTLFKELNWALDELAPELITVYYGEDVNEDDASKAAETIASCFPEAEVSTVNGGQPVYYYMISLE